MRPPDFRDLGTRGHYRIQRVFGVLQDEPGALAANATHDPLISVQNVDSVEGQAVGSNSRLGWQQLKDGARGQRFTGSRLPNDAELLLSEGERDPSHYLSQPQWPWEGDT